MWKSSTSLRQISKRSGASKLGWKLRSRRIKPSASKRCFLPRNIAVSSRRRSDSDLRVRLIYVLLDSPQRNMERVRLRVKKGGHGVPEDKILERHARSLEQMPWFLEQADQAWLYDNSGASPKLIAEKHAGMVTLDEDALPFVVEAVSKIQSGHR